MEYHIIVDLGEDTFWVGDVWYPNSEDTISLDINDLPDDVLGVLTEIY